MDNTFNAACRIVFMGFGSFYAFIGFLRIRITGRLAARSSQELSCTFIAFDYHSILPVYIAKHGIILNITMSGGKYVYS